MREDQGLLEVSATVILDSNGDGTIDFGVQNAWQRWEVTTVVVSTNQAKNQTPYPVAAVYAGPIAEPYVQGVSWTGNQDTFSGVVNVHEGSDLHVVWTGGIAGTVAKARVYGTRYTRMS